LSEVTDKIAAKGHWSVAIRPEPYLGDRVPYEDLDEILVGAAVRMRGWPVPFIDNRVEPLRGEDWIGQDIDAEMVSHHEAWRFFTSGQFNHLRAVSADWREGTEASAVPEGFDAVIEVWEVLFYLTEIFELAARLALSPAGSEQMSVEVDLNGLSDRGLIVGDRRRSSFMVPYRAGVESLARTVTLPREELVAEPRDQAVAMSREFFLRFGWKPSVELLADYQRELTERH
jgi:hypothetical protein